MSAFNKVKEFEEAVKQAEADLAAVYPPAAEEAKLEDAPVPEAPAEPVPAPETPTPEPENEWEKKYKDSIKGMNEAQRKAAELAKAKEEQDKRISDMEAKLQEALEHAKKVQESAKAQPVEIEDDLEADMPEVAKIAQKYASKAQKDLEKRLAEIDARLKAEEENRKRIESDTTARKMMDEIKTVHPDYDTVVNSDEMVNWINNDAPPIYKAIFEGAIPFHAKDAIAVLNAYKSTTTPKPKAPVASTPSAAEVAAPVKTTTPISTRLKTDAPLTEKDMEYFMHNSHRMKSEELAEWDRKLNGTT